VIGAGHRDGTALLINSLATSACLMATDGWELYLMAGWTIAVWYSTFSSGMATIRIFLCFLAARSIATLFVLAFGI